MPQLVLTNKGDQSPVGLVTVNRLNVLISLAFSSTQNINAVRPILDSSFRMEKNQNKKSLKLVMPKFWIKTAADTNADTRSIVCEHWELIEVEQSKMCGGLCEFI